MTQEAFDKIKEQIKGRFAQLNITFIESPNMFKSDSYLCYLCKSTIYLFCSPIYNQSNARIDHEHTFGYFNFRGACAGIHQIISIEIVNGEIDIHDLLFGTQLKKLDLTQFTKTFTPKYTIPQLKFKGPTTVSLYNISVPGSIEGILADCGALNFKGQNGLRYTSIDEIQSTLILQLLNSFTSNLASKSYIICSGQNDIGEYLTSATKEFFHGFGTLPSLNQIINYMALYSNGLHPATHRGYERKDTVSDRGFKHWNGEVVTSRNHWFHYITLDGIHKFYASEDFQKLNLLSL